MQQHHNQTPWIERFSGRGLNQVSSRSLYRSLSLLFLSILAVTLSACSGQGPNVTDPDANERNETSLITLKGENGGRLAHFYEVSGLVDDSEYETVNGSPLGLTIDAIYEKYEQIWMHSNATGQIVVLDLASRKELARISGFPSGTDGELNGMAFSNLSQAWIIAYGSQNLYHVDARNLELVGSIPLPGNPTAITTVDNRILVGLENPDGTGSIALLHSNDPDFAVQIVATLRRPPFYMQTNPDNGFVALLVPGEPEDLPETAFIDTDPALMMLDLLNYSFPFEGRFISPSLSEYVGQHPTYAAYTNDFFLYLATPEGVKRIDTKSWGQVVDLFPGKAYSIVAADYWSDLVYAVPTESPNVIERKDKYEESLSSITLDNPITSVLFVSTSKVKH